MTDATNGLQIVDACELSDAHRALLRPGELMQTRQGSVHRLPRFFYEVQSSKVAVETLLTPHFGLWELMEVDLFEALPLRRYPRYVPCAVTVLASALEVLRAEIGAPIRVAANGGYRSPAHALGSRAASPHCWGCAANIFKIGNDFIDSEEKLQKYAAIAARTLTGCWTRPYGHNSGECDDHLHIDLGYVTVVPRGASEVRGD